MRAIDHRASARLSSAQDNDVLVVREFLTEEAARVVIVLDRRPSMSLFPPGLPWLSKPAAVAAIGRLLAESAAEARCLFGTLDRDENGKHVWRAPDGRLGSDEIIGDLETASTFCAPEDCLESAFGFLTRLGRAVSPGTFVFVVSDFLMMPSPGVWERALARKWDLVPVVVQDHVWEQSFPDVSGAVLAVADPTTGETHRVRLNAAEVARFRSEHEARFEQLLSRFHVLDLDRVLVSAADAGHVLDAFSVWAEGRRQGARLVR